MKLLTPASYQTKLRKTEKNQPEYSVWSLSLSPADEAGTGISNCSHSVIGCEAACVGNNRSGLSAMFSSISESRASKTRYLQSDPDGFCRQLIAEITLVEIHDRNAEKRSAIRLNAFSDLDWESEKYAGGIPQKFPDILFYDYSKRMHRAKTGKIPPNYSICWSYSGKNSDGCLERLEAGDNVAVVFAQEGSFASSGAMRQDLPKSWRMPGSSKSWTVFDGDTQDMRIPGIDPGPTRAGRGRICGLRLKGGIEGRRIAIETGFAVIWG